MDATLPAEQRSSSVLTAGFGAAIAMWAIGYFGRLPMALLPGPLLLVLFLACQLGGGWVVGRLAGLGWRHGAVTGLITGTLNLLVLGSLLAEGPASGGVPSALLWLPGSVLLAAALGAAGAAIGALRPRSRGPYVEWPAALVRPH